MLKLSSSRIVKLHLVFISAQITIYPNIFIEYEKWAINFYNRKLKSVKVYIYKIYQVLWFTRFMDTQIHHLNLQQCFTESLKIMHTTTYSSSGLYWTWRT